MPNRDPGFPVKTILDTAFLRFYCYQLKTYDCDSALYVMRYLMNRFELNIEQRYWLCWLYANTYHLPTSWVMFNEFPDFENVGLERLDKWVAANKQRLPYQKDQKWLRGQLSMTFRAYQAAVKPFGSQAAFWASFGDRFDAAWRTLLSPRFPKFGRYTAWFFLQAVNETCGHRFEAPHLFLDDPSSKQPREGLELVADDLGSVSAPREWLAGEILNWAQAITAGEDLPVRADRFSLETSLCAWSKMPRGTGKGRYLGYYLDRIAEDIKATAKHDWAGINWDALWDARSEVLLPSMDFLQVRPSEMPSWPLYGQFCSDSELLGQLDRWFDSKLSLL